jgi:predicted transcriptional regulator
VTPEIVPISPATRSVLLELVARTGRPAAELLDAAVADYRRRLAEAPVTSVPGVDPADVWEAHAQAEAGQLTPHDEVFAKLRGRP